MIQKIGVLRGVFCRLGKTYRAMAKNGRKGRLRRRELKREEIPHGGKLAAGEDVHNGLFRQQVFLSDGVLFVDCQPLPSS